MHVSLTNQVKDRTHQYMRSKYKNCAQQIQLRNTLLSIHNYLQRVHKQ